MSVCGWRVWQEKRWPWQWVGQCGDGLTCRGGIRCNDRVTAEAYFDKSQAAHCIAPSLPTQEQP